MLSSGTLTTFCGRTESRNGRKKQSVDNRLMVEIFKKSWYNVYSIYIVNQKGILHNERIH